MVTDGLALLGFGLCGLVWSNLLGRPVFKLRWRAFDEELQYFDELDKRKYDIRSQQRNSMWFVGWLFSSVGLAVTAGGVVRYVVERL